MPTPDTCLSVRDLHVYYGGIAAVRGVSFEVHSGEIVSLLGSNGAGKTTVLRTISGLQRPKSGTVLLGATDITRWPAHSIASAGLSHVPEGRHIFGPLTVQENLRLGAYGSRAGGRELAARVDLVYGLFPRLRERQGQLGGTLSGGEQQMLAIGRALMGRPSVLALDEPSLGLSPILVKLILHKVREIAGSGVGVLLVEQNAREALRIADQAYVLEAGSVVLHGRSATLRHDPRVQAAYLGGPADARSLSTMDESTSASRGGGSDGH